MWSFFFDQKTKNMVDTYEKLSETLQKKIGEVQLQIGNTPLYEVTKLYSKPGVKIYAKAEWEQLSGSVKARAAFQIFKEALLAGCLREGQSLLDATSGNTGIAYAAIGKALGIPVTLFVPENASKERKELLKSFGANVIYTSKFGGTDEAQQAAAEAAEQFPERYYYANQYANPHNWKAHYYGTALEIIRQVPNITHFVAGLGTTGTFVGTGRRLLAHNPNIELVALQPDCALHGLEGWKHLETALVPAIYDAALPQRFVEIGTQTAYQYIVKTARTEGWLLSPSAAANLAGAIAVAETIREGVIVTVLPDNALKYSEIINKLF